MTETAFIYHPECDLHQPGKAHPEHPARVQAIMRHLNNIGLSDVLLMEQVADRASYNDVLRVHHPKHIEQVDRLQPDHGCIQVEGDTWVSPGSLDAIYLAAGAGVMAAKDIMAGHYKRAFCCVRPPGHHAEVDRVMGFCFFNNIAVAAQLLRHEYGLEKIAILDFDVHHGNGTASIFQNIPDVLFCSSFQYPHYPERYTNVDRPNMVFSRLPAGSDSSTVKRVWQDDWLPALEKHQPEMILVCAGFDAHTADPMADLGWHSEDYYWLTRQIVEFSEKHCDGRILSMLEGGYHLQALSVCVEKHLLALSDLPYDWKPE